MKPITRQHAKLSASSAHRWVNCTASYLMEKDVADKPSPYAERGTLLHNIAETKLTRQHSLDLGIGTAITDEELAAVNAYVDYVNALEGETFTEHRVDFSHVVPEGFGTADAINFNGDTLTIVDLKTGRGVRVNAKNNDQMVLYAIGALHTFHKLAEPVTKIKLVVHQAIVDNVSVWETNLIHLAYLAKKFTKAAIEAFDPDKAEFNPSEPACRFCKAAGKCRAYRDYSFELVSDGFEDSTAKEFITRNSLSEDEIAAVLNREKAIEAFLGHVRDEAHKRLVTGQNIPGFALVPGRNSRHWVDESEIERVLQAKRIPVKTIFPRKLISVAQAEKKLGTGNPIFDGLIAIKKGRPRVAKATPDTKTIDLSDGFQAVA